MFTNLLKAAVAVTLTPVAIVGDVLTLPKSAHEDKPAFGMTEELLKAVGNNVKEAVK